jgi:hypothetical protein
LRNHSGTWQKAKKIGTLRPKQKRTTGKDTKTGFVVGSAGFAKISAVEGIRLARP